METRDPTSPSEGVVPPEAAAAVEREVRDARDRLSAVAHDLRDEAAHAGETITARVAEVAERRKDETADSLRDFAETIRRAADELVANDRSMAARVVQSAAHGLEDLSNGLQARSVVEMTQTVSEFGRRNPAAFMTGCLLAGVAIGRFLIASGARAEDQRYASGGGDWSSADQGGYGAASVEAQASGGYDRGEGFTPILDEAPLLDEQTTLDDGSDPFSQVDALPDANRDAPGGAPGASTSNPGVSSPGLSGAGVSSPGLSSDVDRKGGGHGGF